MIGGLTARHVPQFPDAVDFVAGRDFGLETILDLRNCNRSFITSTEHLDQYATQLCAVLDMQPFGPPWIQHFGHKSATTSGYTLFQPIETSSITGHFSDAECRAMLNIHSCKRYDTVVVGEFSKKFFGADHMTYTILVR